APGRRRWPGRVPDRAWRTPRRDRPRRCRLRAGRARRRRACRTHRRPAVGRRRTPWARIPRGRRTRRPMGGRQGAPGTVTVPTYSVVLRAGVEKQLAALDKPIRRRVASAIDALAANPRPAGAIALQGMSGLLRIRVGDYRIIYAVNDGELIVLVV